MFYLIGLGNPGTAYKKTRHNVGWLALDALIVLWELPPARPVKHCSGRVTEGVVAGGEVTVLYPETYMNKSGTAVRALVPRGEEGNCIVIYDDVDLPYGQTKISYGNGAGGHNGVASLIETLGTKYFFRLRVGIGRRPEETSGVVRPLGEELGTYVLATIPPAELTVYQELFPRIASMVETIMLEGKERAMTKWN